MLLSHIYFLTFTVSLFKITHVIKHILIYIKVSNISEDKEVYILIVPNSAVLGYTERTSNKYPFQNC